MVLLGAPALVWTASPNTGPLRTKVEARLRGVAARPVSLGQVAPIFVRALVATEDERFFHHDGIDVVGLARAIPYDVVHLSFAQGASTITEQVAKALYLGGNDHSPWRKLEDMALAVKLESHYTKTQILDAYLNVTYFGAGAVGVAAASATYFGVTPRRLSLAQASLLAGLPQAPSADDPLRHPHAARARQLAVLRSLVRAGVITAPQASSVLAHPLRLRGGSRLPAEPGLSVAPGPALAWRDAVVGAILAAGGILTLLLVRRSQTNPTIERSATGLATLMLLLGIVTALRSFRTL